MILEVIARARRLLWNAMAAVGARAVCTGFGVADSPPAAGHRHSRLALSAVRFPATLAVAAYLTWRRLPTLCAAAQLLDRRLGLQDAMSTALFFWPHHPPRQFDEGMRQARTYAEGIAARIDVRAAPAADTIAGGLCRCGARLSPGLFGCDTASRAAWT
jgi:hypothetical protein